MSKNESSYAPFEEEFEIHLPEDADARKIVASNLAVCACIMLKLGDNSDTGKKAMYTYSLIERQLEKLSANTRR